MVCAVHANLQQLHREETHCSCPVSAGTATVDPGRHQGRLQSPKQNTKHIFISVVSMKTIKEIKESVVYRSVAERND